MSLVQEWHEARKQRLARFEAKAFRPVVVVNNPVNKEVAEAPPAIVRDAGDELAWRMVIEGFNPAASPLPQLYVIRKRVCEHFQVPLADFLGPRRDAPTVLARHVAYYLATKITVQSLPEIGRRFGGKDHTTILHGSRRIARLIETDSGLADAVDTLTKALKGQDVTADRKKHTKLTPDIVRAIRASHGSSSDIAEAHGVSDFTIRQVRARRIWRSVE
jgi:hypothetical protein